MAATKNIIAICIATYKRPDLLSNCLNSIGRITIPHRYKPIIIVVDNDDKQSGKIKFTEAANNIDIESHYYVEPDRGICAARNCLLEKALIYETKYIAFIDDDEQTHKEWLVNLMNGLESYACDIVAGPALPITSKKAPDTFIIDPKRPTGSIPRNISTANVLFDVKLVNELNLRFDRYFDFIGCEDHDFFARAKKQNMKAVWIDDAVTFESITPERNTRRYMMYRHFTGGINVVLRYRRHNALIFAWGRYLPKALGKIIGALYYLIKAIFVSHLSNFDKFIVKLSNGIGYICGLTNLIFERYRY